MLEVRIVCPDQLKEIILAELEMLPYEGFWDQADTILAYISEDSFSMQALSEVLRKYGIENNFSVDQMPEKNWNEEWESHFQPFELENKVRVRADFHPSSDAFEHEIIIKPKMSFGTGHHETTHLMMKYMLEIDFVGKQVLDMGSGTGILAILAEKLGAFQVMAIDNDQWSFENMPENFEANACESIDLKLGGIEALQSEVSNSYDMVLSNITKNINLELLPELCRLVSSNGLLVISGFLDFDLEDMRQSAKKHGLQFVSHQELNHWQAALFIKTNSD